MQQHEHSGGDRDAEAVSDAKHLLFLADLFERAAALIMLTRSMAHPFTIAHAIMQVLRGKLWRGELTPGDVQVVPALISWIGAGLQRAGTTA
jgi:hypothetical protein